MDPTLGLVARDPRHGGAEVEIAGLVTRRVGIGEIVRDELGAAPAHVERGCVHTKVLIEIHGHGSLLASAIRRTGSKASYVPPALFARRTAASEGRGSGVVTWRAPWGRTIAAGGRVLPHVVRINVTAPAWN